MGGRTAIKEQRGGGILEKVKGDRTKEIIDFNDK